MRLREVEKGDGLFRRLLIRFISNVSGMRLPDAARIVMYHRDFYGKPMATWTHAAMRGKSNWSVGERELFAAMTAKWNSCPFCIEAHGAIASLVLDKTLVAAALEDFQKAHLPPKLYTTLQFLEKLVKTPDDLNKEQVAAILQSGISTQELEDAMAVAALFCITVRCANVLKFDMLNDADQSRAAKRMLQQGYVFGKGKPEGHPDHEVMARKLTTCIFEGPGIISVDLRQAIASRIAGGPALPEPVYDVLVQQIEKNSYKITEELIQQLVRLTGNEKAAFEFITTVAVASGLLRWQRGLNLLKAVKNYEIDIE